MNKRSLIGISLLSILITALSLGSTTEPTDKEKAEKIQDAVNRVLMEQRINLKRLDSAENNIIDFDDFDLDKNGVITREEIADKFRTLNAGTEIQLDDAAQDPTKPINSAKAKVEEYADLHPNYTTNDIEKLAIKVADEPKSKKLPWGIKVRRESSGKLPELADIEKGKPALVQFAKDFDKDTDIWTVQIAAYRPITIQENDTTDSKYETVLLPTVTWDRINGKGDSDPKDKNVNLVGGKLGVSRMKMRRASFYDEKRLFVGYAQDEESGSRLFSVEAFAQPFYQPKGLGMFKDVGDYWRYKFDVSAGFTGRRVSDAGTDEDLAKHRRNFWFSSRLGFSFQPTTEGWKLLTFKIGYDWDSAISGNIQKSELFEAGISGSLDPKENFTVELTYTKGDSTLVKASTETLQLGVGLKY